MPRIVQLSPHVINKIAAGEVIERPASVVKELLENSVDALATRIEVDVTDGGLESIRIVDDGEGIHPDDLLLAVHSHATSKLQEADDLFRVRTLGFRGEALASIAEVSRFLIRSRQPEAEMGVEVEVNAGEQTEPRPCGCAVGTTIEVRQLFLNTPVRRKFLKTPATELGHITEQFTRIALANPRLHLVLRHQQRTIYELPATDRLGDRLRLFYGDDLADKLISVEAERDGLRIWGFVAHPSESKATRKNQYLFLNGRWIQDRSLQHALGEAYRGLLMVGRHPVCFLFLEMPPELVDVNVHPTKAEVRFQNSQPLYRLLLSTLRTRFLGMNLESEIRVPGGPRTAPAPTPVIDTQRQLDLQYQLADWAKAQLSAPPAYPLEYDTPEHADAGPQEWTADSVAPTVSSHAWTAENLTNSPFSGEHVPPTFPPRPEPGLSQPIAAPPDQTPTPPMRAMQIHDCYLVAETDEGLTVIDQHALHERILYEQFRTRVLGGNVESQRMLIPETIELGPAERTLVLEQTETLRQMGLGIEEFGGQTLLLTSYPVMLGRTDPVQLVREVVDKIVGTGQAPSRRDLLDELLHMMSCKAAIKSGQRLGPEEIEALLAQRNLVDDAHHCPHGRPTALNLTRAELDRQFGRLG